MLETRASFQVGDDGLSLTFTVEPAIGSYADASTHRNYEFRVRGAWAPVAVKAIGHTDPKVLSLGKPRHSCGRIACRMQSAGAAYWWDSATLTAFVRLDDIDIRVGASVTLSFSTTLRHAALWSAAAGPVGMLRRARDVKLFIDGEAWLNAKPSVALNRLATTASRMTAKPNTAPAELTELLDAVAHVVAVHAPDNKELAFGAHQGLRLQKRGHHQMACHH